MLVYKITVTLLFFFFVYFISDFRNKKTILLFPKTVMVVMQVGYLIPPTCFLYFLWKLDKWSGNCLATLFMLLLGLFIVIVSKNELGHRHSWAGQVVKQPKDYCVTGIYAWIRHPIYLGIMVAVTGLSFIVLPGFNLQIQLACTYLIGSAITFGFLIVSGNKETLFLTEKFGDPFEEYARQVNAFLPIRKYKDPSYSNSIDFN